VEQKKLNPRSHYDEGCGCVDCQRVKQYIVDIRASTKAICERIQRNGIVTAQHLSLYINAR
jgi:hypothetical protein